VIGTSGFGVRGRVMAAMEEVGTQMNADGPQIAAGKAGHGKQPLPNSKRRGRAWWIAAFFLCLAFWQLTSAGWIHAKAHVAQQLISWSWNDTREGHGKKRPWPWADTRPVAKLRVPGRKVELFVLEGTSARSLAYGPGHVSGTASPGAEGNSVIVAHRDTHFAFLRDMHADDVIAIDTVKGTTVKYRVREAVIVDQADTRVMEPADASQLTLITCYPFDAVLPGTTQRYVVIADRIA